MSTKNTLYINPNSGSVLEKLNATIRVLNVITEQMTETTVPENKTQAERDNLLMQANMVESVVDEYSTVIGG